MLKERWLSQSRYGGLFGAVLLLPPPAFGAGAATSKVWLSLTGPLIVTLTAIWALRLVYFWQRKASFARRERRRMEDPAEKLEIPEGLKKVEQFKGGHSLHEAQCTFIGQAVSAQGDYFANGILAGILPPLALLLLSLQLLAMPAGGDWAVGVIISEISCLLLLVYLALTSREPTSAWIENRVRTELFRREQYLFLAGVGPYLLLSPSEGAEEALRRRGQIEAADASMLVRLIPMQESSGVTWLEVLHHRGVAKLPSRLDVQERINTYLYYRIGKQLQWFANEIRDIRENEDNWSRLLTGALLSAIAIAVLHAFHLRNAPISAAAADGEGAWRVVIGMLAIVLPPVGTACLSIKGMYNYSGRTRIYEHQKSLLHIQRGALEALLSEMHRLPVGGKQRNGDMIDFSFRAIALRTEQSLSVELAEWLLLMEKHEHERSP